MKMLATSTFSLLCLLASTVYSGERDDKVNGDRSAFEDSDLWIYNDLDKGLKVAAAVGKPLMVVHRCIP